MFTHTRVLVHINTCTQILICLLPWRQGWKEDRSSIYFYCLSLLLCWASIPKEVSISDTYPLKPPACTFTSILLSYAITLFLLSSVFAQQSLAMIIELNNAFFHFKNISSLLVSALTCLLGAHPVASGPLGSPFLAVVGHVSLRVPDTVNWRSGSQTNTPPGYDLAQSWRRAQPQGEARQILSDRVNEWMSEWAKCSAVYMVCPHLVATR